MTIVRPGGAALGRHRSTSRLTVEVAVRDGNAVVAVVGELDVAGIDRFRAVVAAVMDIPGIGRIEIDGRRLDFVDSTGLRGLLTSRADAQLAGVSWFLGVASPALRRLLELCGVGDLLSDPAVN